MIDSLTCLSFLFLKSDIKCKDQVCFDRNVNLTLKPDPSYDGGSATLTAHLNDSHHYSHLLYLFCYDIHLLDFIELGCVESNSTTASLSFTWNLTGSTSASVYVFNGTRKGGGEREPVGCVVRNDIDVGGKSLVFVHTRFG